MAALGACAMSLWGNAARLTAVNSRVEPRGNMGVESEVLRATTAFRPVELTAVNFVFGGGALRKLAIAALCRADRKIYTRSILSGDNGGRRLSMNKRKDQLRSLFGVESAPETKSMTPLPTPDPTEAPKRSAAGAVRAMGLSLGALSQEIEDARRLRDSLEGAERVIDLDAARIERSPFADRLSSGSSGDEQFDALKRSIAEHGQQVPVLVRPHPDAAKAGEGIYQAAYGHRRIEAARQAASRSAPSSRQCRMSNSPRRKVRKTPSGETSPMSSVPSSRMRF